LYFSDIKIIIDATVHFEHGTLNKCDFKPRSVEKCGDVQNEPI
jgi:hypothetical protein